MTTKACAWPWQLAKLLGRSLAEGFTYLMFERYLQYKMLKVHSSILNLPWRGWTPPNCRGAQCFLYKMDGPGNWYLCPFCTIFTYCTASCLIKFGVFAYCTASCPIKFGVFAYCTASCLIKFGVFADCTASCLIKFGVFGYCTASWLIKFGFFLIIPLVASSNLVFCLLYR